MDSIMFERACRVMISQIEGVGVKTFAQILKLMGGKMSNIFSPKFPLSMVALKNNSNFQTSTKLKLLGKIEDAIKLDPVKNLLNLESQGLRALVLGIDGEYPMGIAKLDNPPPVLYLRGELRPTDLQAIAVVGTRKPTSYGIKVTEMLVGDLVTAGYTIISGLAFGIDAVAHQTAIELGGRTIGFLASGIDEITPHSHQKLGEEILLNGAILSAFPPKTVVNKGNFVARNRLVAGMSLGVLVTEGGIKSGTGLTAEFALEQNKPVFAVPGPITSRVSLGPLELVNRGAVLTTSATQIVERLGKKSISKQISVSKINNLDETQKLIYEVVENEGVMVDELVRQLKLSAPVIMSNLTMMEIEGLIECKSGMWRKK